MVYGVFIADRADEVNNYRKETDSLRKRIKDKGLELSDKVKSLENKEAIYRGLDGLFGALALTSPIGVMFVEPYIEQFLLYFGLFSPAQLKGNEFLVACSYVGLSVIGWGTFNILNAHYAEKYIKELKKQAES